MGLCYIVDLTYIEATLAENMDKYWQNHACELAQGCQISRTPC